MRFCATVQDCIPTTSDAEVRWISWRVVRKRECLEAVLWLFNLAARTYDLMGSPTGEFLQCKDETWVNQKRCCKQKVVTIAGCFEMRYVIVELEEISVFSSVLGLS